MNINNISIIRNVVTHMRIPVISTGDRITGPTKTIICVVYISK